jgi:hypothetical protein
MSAQPPQKAHPESKPEATPDEPNQEPRYGSPLSPQWSGRDAFKVPEAAEILGIGAWAAWRAVQRGEIASTRIGGRVIVPRLVLERLLGGDWK